MNMIKRVFKENNGMGVVEVVLIILVLVGLVLIFKNQITSIVKSVFDTISTEVSKL
jgi:Flp pilus assembly pilin Flp